MAIIYQNYPEDFQHTQDTIHKIRTKFSKTKVGKTSKIDGIIFRKTDSGEEVDIKYSPVPVERIRRITGYLVGKPERWNDGKWAELQDRVKHGSLAMA